MPNEFRALCADLIEAIEDDDFFSSNHALRFSKAVLSARTALASADVVERLSSRRQSAAIA